MDFSLFSEAKECWRLIAALFAARLCGLDPDRAQEG
jgi:hypothetical protein